MTPIFLAAMVGLAAVGIYLAANGSLSMLSATASDFTAALVGNLNAAQIAQYASNAGWSGSDLVTAVAIALAESAGNPNAIGDTSLAPTNGPSYGLWQVNVGSKANPQYAHDNLFDPQTNANDAYEIYQNHGNSFSAWSTYGGGQYQAFLASAQTAAAGTANA
jgi:lysozyme-like protein